MAGAPHNTCSLMVFKRNPRLSGKNHAFDLKKQHPRDGLYAYIVYEAGQTHYLILRELDNYTSCHGAIHLIAVPTIHGQQPRQTFFGSSITPLFGGELLWYRGAIVCWDFQSGAFSLSNPQYHDEHITLDGPIVKHSGFPPECFIRIAEAKTYKHYFFPMRDFSHHHLASLWFQPNGQFTNDAYAAKIIDKIYKLIGRCAPHDGHAHQSPMAFNAIG